MHERNSRMILRNDWKKSFFFLLIVTKHEIADPSLRNSRLLETQARDMHFYDKRKLDSRNECYNVNDCVI